MILREPGNDDQLLRALGEAARAEEASPDAESLEALVRGELGPTERAALARRADTEPALAAALQAYTPVEDATRARFTEAVLSVLPAASKEPDEKLFDAQPSPAPARPRRLPWRLFSAWTMPVVAAAAGLALFAQGKQPSPLPTYSVQFFGFEAQMRAERETITATENVVLTVGPRTSLVALLRPETSAAGEVAVRSFFVRAGQAEPWPAQVETAPSGGVRVRLRPPAPGWSGKAHLAVWLGPPADVERSYAELGTLTSESSTVQHWRQPIFVREAP